MNALIATRGSQLALWQANHVTALLKAQGLASELNIIKTTGDRVQDRFLHEMGGKGLFVRELEDAMLSGRADLAVHSLKDLPAKLPSGFELPAILKRHIPNDVIIFHPKKDHMKQIGAERVITRDQLALLGPLTIATASLRRQSLLKGLGTGIHTVAIRGNVDTRIKKLEDSDWDALILAGASLERLGLEHLPHKLIDLEWFVPCAAQGALAIETRHDSVHKPVIARLSDPRTYACASIERKILELLGGDCTMPFGAFASYDGQETRIRVVVLDYEGQEARVSMGVAGTPESLPIVETAENVIRELQKHGVSEILSRLSLKAPDLGPIN